MKHTPISSTWRPKRIAADDPFGVGAVLSTLAFNLCLLLLPVAAALALAVISRDGLYGYEHSPSSARATAQRIARLNGELIQLDFDRQNQWDDLVLMELRNNDFGAARGFLLSGSGMLPSRAAGVLNHADANDRELEVAALQLLSPSTRGRYETAAQQSQAAAQAPVVIGTPEDFQLMGSALLAEPETDTLQFILTGYALGLAGDLSPRMDRGAAALLEASRREDYPETFGAEVSALLAASLPMPAFRESARARGGEAESIAALTAAFRAAVNPSKVDEVRALLDSIGAISDATSQHGAAALLTHAQALGDLPRLRLLAQAAGDRAAAAAKRLPRDGRLLAAAQGRLAMNRDLIAALSVAALAFAGLLAMVGWRAWRSTTTAVRQWSDDDEEYDSDLIELGASPTSWRPL